MVEETRKELDDPDGSYWQDTAANGITLCVAHELDPTQTESHRAVAVAGGISVCPAHLKRVVNAIVDGYNIGDILSDITRGQF